MSGRRRPYEGATEVDFSRETLWVRYKGLSKMRPIKTWLILMFFFATVHVAHAEPLAKAALIGRWDYTTYTALQKGKPVGAVQFKPLTMLFTYREDGTWEMEAADTTHTRLSGNFEIHGTELIMKKADGSLYQDFDVELKNNGKGMILRDKRSIITANKIEAAP